MERDSTAAAGAARTPKPQAGKYRGEFAPPSALASFKLDEGYSDETRSQAENEVIQTSDEGVGLPSWILAHNEADRAELAYSILRTLSTSTVSSVVDRLTPLLHMDPVLKLPPEITSEIFSYLDTPTLLTAALASRAWRARIIDSRLWRHLYIQEGWRFDMDAVRSFEQSHSKPHFSLNRKSRTRHSDADIGQPKLKKRVPPGWIHSRRDSRADNNNIQTASPPWNEQHETVEADGTSASEINTLPDAEGDHEMRDASYDDYSVGLSQDQNRPRQPLEVFSPLHSRKSSRADGFARHMSFYSPLTNYTPQVKPPHLMRTANGTCRLNWPYLYRQRRKLEDNWRKGHFVNFQLPHPAYPSEAHTECVYTIQFSGKWLVSGSRDRTVRVWNLETRRLRGNPLVAHSKSVLCLQFDPSPEEDIIISGSSDRSVIIWRFSTGEKIHELTNAHQDSVLNLRFDKRYLVTCSKDKLIKIWNRHELCPTDKDYPSFFNGTGVKYPSYIVDTSLISPSALEAQIANRQIKTLSPYSLLMTLDGHGAAVNAIQMNENEIVSASGDRLIKVWDIHNGACRKTLIGHKKGIACVQFDSRRIVSGSNDDTVRIYDHASAAEVACLHGHRGLVRTVQAGFGDPPGADETLRLEAMAVDNQYWKARLRGDIAESSSAVRRLHRSCPVRTSGSRDPNDIMALGAKIPPGGGGSCWARIVSGSYDESIIIWKKDHEGKWVIGQRLRQDEAVRAAGANVVPDTRAPTSQPIPLLPSQAPQGFIGLQSMSQTSQQNSSASTVQSNPPNANTTIPQGTTNDAGPPSLNGTNQQPPQTLQNQAQPPLHGANRPLTLPAAHPTARVFKLQFDARQLICASLDHRIVGWDFAYGDQELEWACQFFTGL
ncbi:F-box and WD domain-containing protein [Histoplasma capsulatum G186AR]|uniref:Probable E3 ubiquitin ligase complex SCF subunit sconB n=2 Tax=Ajellomyces capsulatus TaxID=5037 RepID=C0NJT1_AJECG|nr:F-box and WD domain-containing protein [Histoplasma capsulatum G186AR]EEH08122.1 F-box and WD domain-containing protein [Histoplasma capsulatum G186AR]KAG5299553.1 F-box and WD domain-containing protein [Histoplasma capsulatum]QSS67822.1 F-box and WD domain-containing protein [Histoplasma capsulatum G186AR]